MLIKATRAAPNNTSIETKDIMPSNKPPLKVISPLLTSLKITA
jgi:hypothetical protein